MPGLHPSPHSTVAFLILQLIRSSFEYKAKYVLHARTDRYGAEEDGEGGQETASSLHQGQGASLDL